MAQILQYDMRTPEHVKRKAMNSITHRETTHMARRYKPGRHVAPAKAAAPSPKLSLTQQAKMQAMNAVRNVETVAHLGWMRVAAGTAVYVAHIRQMDRDARTQKKQRDARPTHWSQTKRDRTGREI